MPSLFLVKKLILQNKTNFDFEHWTLNIWFEHLKNFEYWKTWKWKSIEFWLSFDWVWLSFDWVLIEFWLSFDWVLNGLKFRKLVPLFVHFDKAEAPFWEIARLSNKISVSRWDQSQWHRKVLDLGKFGSFKAAKQGRLKLMNNKFPWPH